MSGYLQAVGMLLLTVVLLLMLKKTNPELAVVLSMGACCIAALALGGYLQPVVAFLKRLEALGKLDGQMVGILYKVVGISLLSEIAAAICTDSGNTGLGKTIQLLSAVVIMCLCVPMLSKLMDLVERILGKL